KKNSQAAVAGLENEAARSSGSNGTAVAVAEAPQADLSVVLGALQTMRDGNFSVRLPGSWPGLAGKSAGTCAEMVSAYAQRAQELQRVGQVVGKEGRTR